MPEIPFPNDRLPVWFSKLLLWAACGAAAAGLHWTSTSITNLNEETAVNKALRENIVSDIHDIKLKLDKLVDTFGAKKP